MSAYFRCGSDDDGGSNYLGRLTQTPLLTKEEEEYLTRAVKKGDPVARKRLIEANMRLVIAVARSYRSPAMPLEDLISEGAVGLIQAAERFDPSRGFRFTTYAMHWIKQSIGRAVDNKAKAIRLPAHVTQSLRKVERTRELLVRELGQEPSLDQLAAAVGLSPRKLGQLMQASQDLLSLDMKVGDSSGVTLGTLISDPSAGRETNPVISDDLIEELHSLMKELNDREQAVLRMKLKLESEEGEVSDIDSAEKLAQELKLSRERVRQIEVMAIRKLRAIAQRRRQAANKPQDS